MRDRSTRRQALGLAGGLLLLTCIASSGVAQAKSGDTTAPFWNALVLVPAEPTTVWVDLRDNFQWQVDTDEPRVREWIDYYRSHPRSVATMAEQARPWLGWVIDELERHGMPGEIALLPFIESAYDPTARNPGGATGLWQFMPGTGDALGLHRDWWYDGRLDVIASTRAAIEYLQQQADQWYDGDLELALAAYNAGAGTVNHALRAAVARGEPADYWHLDLPRQTMDYVPKLLALSKIIAEPERYGVSLPKIPDNPAFARVEVQGQLALERIASLADVSLDKLEALNPALLQATTVPQRAGGLLVPYDARETLLSALAEQPDEAIAFMDRYQVQPGDTLSAIAARHSVPVSILREYNGLSGDMIRVGQVLKLPSDSAPTQSTGDTFIVQVRSGDSLSGIAAQHNVSVTDIARWNDLDADQYLQPGQLLTLYREG
ncbi:membrane-bound lytic murein transglycosylase D [Modicisalibacter muralis]|uniref:Membrane-bound lytic murein transglycosylase D n=1 Tax=Modicisalibacter muralis TaxID=119000 RepID=A0A1G9GMG1_9GAMM|nr:LysM peptidoglycan-binding domain-containing protein [Halomonas muralis]SDL01880.1 membrane-bound lytic murein transglycosylase D [Halomonas muralis]